MNSEVITVVPPASEVIQTVAMPARPIGSMPVIGGYAQPLETAITMLRIKQKGIQHEAFPLSALTPSVNSKGEFVFELAGKQLKPTERMILDSAESLNVHGGFCADLLKNRQGLRLNANAKIIRDEGDASTLCAVYKNAMRRLPQNKLFLFRVHDNTSLRAMLSTRYTPITNLWFLEQVQEICQDNALVAHWYGDCDTLYVNLLIPTTTGKLAGGLHLSNCEIGSRQCDTMLSVLNLDKWVCYNLQPKGSNGIKGSHRGGVNLDGLRSQLRQNLHQQFARMPHAIKQIESMKGITISAEKAVKLLKDRLYGKTPSAAILERMQFQADESLFDVATSLSEVAQSHESPVRFTCEGIAGSLSNP